MKGKNILCTILLLILLPFLFAQNYESSFGPSRPMGENHQGPMQRLPAGDYFALIGVRVEERENEMILSLYFNGAVDAYSFQTQNISINGTTLQPMTRFMFSKSRHMAQFSIPAQSEAFSLSLRNLKSSSGKNLRNTELKDLTPNSFLKFSREARQWQKSSL